MDKPTTSQLWYVWLQAHGRTMADDGFGNLMPAATFAKFALLYLFVTGELPT